MQNVRFDILHDLKLDFVQIYGNWPTFHLWAADRICRIRTVQIAVTAALNETMRQSFVSLHIDFSRIRKSWYREFELQPGREVGNWKAAWIAKCIFYSGDSFLVPKMSLLKLELIGYCDNRLKRHFCQTPSVPLWPRFSAVKYLIVLCFQIYCIDIVSRNAKLFYGLCILWETRQLEKSRKKSWGVLIGPNNPASQCSAPMCFKLRLSTLALVRVYLYSISNCKSERPAATGLPA